MDLEGTTVRADAMMCQTSIAEIIARKGGDYCFTVKSNLPTLLKDIKDYFESDPKCETCTTVGKGQTFSKRECIEYPTTLRGLIQKKNGPVVRPLAALRRQLKVLANRAQKFITSSSLLRGLQSSRGIYVDTGGS